MCKNAILFLFDIGKKYLKNLVKHMQTNDIKPRTQGTAGRNPLIHCPLKKSSLWCSSLKDILRIMAFPCRLLQEVGTQNHQLVYPVLTLRTSIIFMLKLIKKSPFV